MLKQCCTAFAAAYCLADAGTCLDRRHHRSRMMVVHACVAEAELSFLLKGRVCPEAFVSLPVLLQKCCVRAHALAKQPVLLKLSMRWQR
jgi:hypothetical protein